MTTRYCRVLFNEACNERLNTLALENFHPWINCNMDTERFAIMAIGKAIRERGGISEATQCRVLFFDEEALNENKHLASKGLAPYALDYRYTAYPKGE